MHIIAGPNGAGKTTLYRYEIKKKYPDAEFVNADEIMIRELGRPATTREEATRGQQLAEQRRRELMGESRSFVTETTFSHPSKLDLVREATAAGYRVILYHVNVRSPELSVLRVDARVNTGGHPVPEKFIRERYERNQPLIRAAAKEADLAYIFDNSSLERRFSLAAVLAKGVAVRVDGQAPAWARELYADEFAQYAHSRAKHAVANLADAKAKRRRGRKAGESAD